MRAVVQGVLLAPPPLSLVRSAPVVDERDDRWEGGFAWEGEGCGFYGTWDPCAAPDAEKDDNPDTPGTLAFQPYMIYAEDRCSTMSRRQDYEARARRALEAVTPAAVESEFWTGERARAHNTEFPGDPWPNAWLASPGAEVINAAPQDPVDALACLEKALRSARGAGMIHATRDVGTLWQERNLLRRVGNVLVTVVDTVVVLGEGYPGTTPAGADPAAGSSYAYATDTVQVRLGRAQVIGVDPAEGVDRKRNTHIVRAERAAAATWNGCRHFAINIAVPNCGA